MSSKNLNRQHIIASRYTVYTTQKHHSAEFNAFVPLLDLTPQLHTLTNVTYICYSSMVSKKQSYGLQELNASSWPESRQQDSCSTFQSRHLPLANFNSIHVQYLFIFSYCSAAIRALYGRRASSSSLQRFYLYKLCLTPHDNNKFWTTWTLHSLSTTPV
jgi:hypothetical protein